MKAKPTVMDRKKPVKIISWGIIILILLMVLFLGRNSFLKVILKYKEAANLQKKVELLQVENEKLRAENHELKTNPDVIEKIARERLGYQKEGEKVYRFLKPEDESKTKQKD
jgi:cell division protein FtsB